MPSPQPLSQRERGLEEPSLSDGYNPPLPLGEGSGVREKMPQARKISILPNIFKNARCLNQKRIGVVRFWSNDVLQQTDSVLQALWQKVHLPSPQPLSQRERGLEEPSLSHE